MATIGGPNTVKNNVIFHYDTGNIKSYAGEPNTNYIHYQNAVAQDSYSPYVWTTDGTWQAKHSKAIRAYNASGSEITGYVNGGVGNPTNVYHAHWQYDEVLKKPVVVMEDFDASWKAKSYGTGIPSWESLGKTVGSTYTISWLQWTGNLSKSARVGLYTRNPSNSYNFWDGLLASSTAKNTELYTWQRVYQTYTTSSSRNLSDAYASIYMYGHYDARATIKIADVQFDWGSYPKQFSPNPTRSETESLLDLTRNSTLDLSNVSFDSNAQIVFDGTDDKIDINRNNIISGTGAFTVEAVINNVSGFGVIIGNYGPSYTSNSIWFFAGGMYLNGGYGYMDNYSSIINGLHHLVSTREIDGTFKTYQDGVLRRNNNPGSPASVRSDINWRIGVDVNSTNSEPFNGDIHIVKAYNRALTAQEVKQNYNAYKNRFNL